MSKKSLNHKEMSIIYKIIVKDVFKLILDIL